MAKVVVIGGVVMDFNFRVPLWPNQDSAVQGWFTSSPGGKGLNHSAACARLGLKTSIISAIGNDANGSILRDTLIHENVGVDHLVNIQEIGSDVTAVIVANNDGKRVIGCRQATNLLTPEHVERAKDIIGAADVVLVTFDASTLAALKAVQLAKELNKRIIINPAPAMEVPLSILDGVDFVTPNNREAREWLRLSGMSTIEELDQMTDVDVAHIYLDQHAQTVIITLGEKGCLVADRIGERYYPSFSEVLGPPVDTTGASAAFCAGLAVQLIEKKVSLSREKEYISFSTAAGGLACQRVGAYQSLPRYADIRGFLERHELLNARQVSSDVEG